MAIQSASNRTILLLISDQLSLSVVQEVLEREGYVVLPTGNFRNEPWTGWTSANPISLIVRSYISSMPGHEAAKYLHAKCPRMRVLILGGLLDDDRLKYRNELDGFHVFPKPYPAAQLLEKVKEVLNAGSGDRKCHAVKFQVMRGHRTIARGCPPIFINIFNLLR